MSNVKPAGFSKFILRGDEGTNLTTEKVIFVNYVLGRNTEVFLEPEGLANVAPFKIQLKENAKTFVGKHYQASTIRMGLFKTKFEALIEKGFLKPIQSEWCSPSFLVFEPGKENDAKLVTNFRMLNRATVRDRYFVPDIQTILNDVEGKKFVSTFGLKSCYWQIPVHEDSLRYFATGLTKEKYCYTRMHPGTLNSATHCRRVVFEMMSNLPNVMARVYRNDLLVMSDTFEEHIRDIEAVLQVLLRYNFRLNRSKCSIFKDKVEFFGYIITSDGVKPNSSKVEAIMKLGIPKNVHQVKSFYYSCQRFEKLICSLSILAKPFYNLLKRDANFIFNRDCVRAFECLKECLCSAQVLARPDFRSGNGFKLYTDVSNNTMGAILTQLDDSKKLVVIEYASKSLLVEERGYSTTEKEALALVWAIKKFGGYLGGKSFVVFSDHKPLQWVERHMYPQGHFGRLMSVQHYNYEVEYMSAGTINIAELLTQPTGEPEPPVFLRRFLAEDHPIKADVLLKVQKTDETCKKIMDGLALEDTEEAIMFMDSGYFLEDGILYRRMRHLENDEPRLVVPKDLQNQVITLNSKKPGISTADFQSIYIKIIAKFWWGGIRQNIRSYFRANGRYQDMKVDKPKSEGTLVSAPIPGRFTAVDVEILGPLPLTKTGKQFVLSVCDISTGYVELLALADPKVETISRLFIEEICFRYGTPTTAHCDTSPQFASYMWQKVATTLGFSLQEPDTNREEAKIRLAIAIGGYRDKWDEALSCIKWAMNTSPSSVSGPTPFQQEFGRVPRSPSDNLLQFSTFCNDRNYINDPISDLLSDLGLHLLQAQKHQEQIQNAPQAFIVKDDQVQNARWNERNLEALTVKDNVRLAISSQRSTATRFIAELDHKRDSLYGIPKLETATPYESRNLKGNASDAFIAKDNVGPATSLQSSAAYDLATERNSHYGISKRESPTTYESFNLKRNASDSVFDDEVRLRWVTSNDDQPPAAKHRKANELPEGASNNRNQTELVFEKSELRGYQIPMYRDRALHCFFNDAGPRNDDVSDERDGRHTRSPSSTQSETAHPNSFGTRRHLSDASPVPLSRFDPIPNRNTRLLPTIFDPDIYQRSMTIWK